MHTFKINNWFVTQLNNSYYNVSFQTGFLFYYYYYFKTTLQIIRKRLNDKELYFKIYLLYYNTIDTRFQLKTIIFVHNSTDCTISFLIIGVMKIKKSY